MQQCNSELLLTQKLEKLNTKYLIAILKANRFTDVGWLPHEVGQFFYFDDDEGYNVIDTGKNIKEIVSDILKNREHIPSKIQAKKNRKRNATRTHGNSSVRKKIREDEKKDAILRWYGEKKSLEEVAFLLNCRKSSVKKIMRSVGISYWINFKSDPSWSAEERCSEDNRN